MQSPTSLRVERSTALDLRDLQTDLARREDRRVTVDELLRRLMEAWRQHGQGRTV